MPCRFYARPCSVCFEASLQKQIFLHEKKVLHALILNKDVTYEQQNKLSFLVVLPRQDTPRLNLEKAL